MLCAFRALAGLTQLTPWIRTGRSWLALRGPLLFCDPTQRELLWLAYAQGASHEEIASILGLRAISIRTLLRRARIKLAGILTAETKTAVTR